MFTKKQIITKILKFPPKKIFFEIFKEITLNIDRLKPAS